MTVLINEMSANKSKCDESSGGKRRRLPKQFKGYVLDTPGLSKSKITRKLKRSKNTKCRPMNDAKEPGESLNVSHIQGAEDPSCDRAILGSVLVSSHHSTDNEDSLTIRENDVVGEGVKTNESEDRRLHLTDSLKEGRVLQNIRYTCSMKQDQASPKRTDASSRPMSHCVSKPYKCQSCNWSFKRKYSLSQHMENYHSENSPRLKRSQPVRMGKTVCEICGKIIKRFSQLQIHLRSHTGEKAFFCDICDRGFNVACNYRRHLLRHGKQNFQCSYCKKQYFEKRHLDIHVLKMHSVKPKHNEVKVASPLVEEEFSEDNKRFTCEHCSKRYAVKESLTHHLQHNHIPCKVCDKICQNSSEYKIHQLVHTSHRPFPCKICDKSFKCRASLGRHVICHTDYMPYTCQVCQKKFRQPQGLWRHKKYHQTEKPHVCSVCSKAFCHKADLKRHSKIHIPKTEAHLPCPGNCQPATLLDGCLSDVGQIKTWICVKCRNQFRGSSELESHTCAAVTRNDTAGMTTAVGSSGADSVAKMSSDARIGERDSTARDCGNLVERGVDLTTSLTVAENEPTVRSLGVGLAETANEALDISECELGLGEGSQTLFEQTLLMNTNKRMKDLVLLPDGTSKMALSEPIAAEQRNILQMQESSLDSALIRGQGHSQLKLAAAPSSNRLIYVVVQPAMDDATNSQQECISESINVDGVDGTVTGCSSEWMFHSGVASLAQGLVNSSSGAVVRKQTTQYAQSLLTGRKVPLTQDSEIFPCAPLSVTQSNLEQIQDIMPVPPDNLLSETEDDKVHK